MSRSLGFGFMGDFYFILVFLEFNPYLQDTARQEIPHRNKKPTERRSFIQFVQFGTSQVEFGCKKCYNNKTHLKRILSRERVDKLLPNRVHSKQLPASAVRSKS